MNRWSASVGIRRAAAVMQRGGVVAYPTEAVWGLGCDPFCQAAVEQILYLKRRPMDKGVILIAHQIEAFAPFLAGLNDDQRRTLAASWPGPVTWLVPNNGAAPDWVTGGQATLALRVTAHPVAAALCASFGGALVSTSANPAGMPPATTGFKVRCYFGRELDGIAPGQVGAAARPSEIRNLTTGQVVRPG